MHFFETLMSKWNTLCIKVKPMGDTLKYIFVEVGKALAVVWRHLVKLRKVFLAVPVGWAAVILAIQNLQKLPETVGLTLEQDGGFSVEIVRELAVLGPVAVTAFCLLLMFCSRRTLTPWFVSLVSLILPYFILLINTFPT